MFAKTYSLQEAIFVSVESISKKIDGKVDVLGFADINSKYNRLSDFLYYEFFLGRFCSNNQWHAVQ